MMKAPRAYFLLVILLLLHGLVAALSALILILQPELMGLQTQWLAPTPFRTYVGPGIILLVFNGFLPILAALGMIFCPRRSVFGLLNIYRDRYWAWTYALYSGLGIIIWITVQITVIAYSWLQPFYLSVGLLILVLSLWPSVIRYFQQ